MLGKDGKTRHRRVRGRDFRKPLAEFGESVWYIRPKTKGKSKAMSRWETGIWLGVREESGEIYMGTDKGVIKVRSIKRKGSKEERWNMVQLDEMVGTPWEPEPGRPDTEVQAQIRARGEEEEGGREEEPANLPAGGLVDSSVILSALLSLIHI